MILCSILQCLNMTVNPLKQQIKVWMPHNFLQLNRKKTEVIIFGPINGRSLIEKPLLVY